MKRLNTLKVERFRQLNEVRIARLGDVNLIVGGNNSGKSTLLDSLRLYASKASPQLIEDLLSEHGELGFPAGDGSFDTASDRSIANLFHGRAFPSGDGQAIYIGELDHSNFIQLEHVFLREEIEERDEEGEITAVRRLKRVEKSSRNNLAELVEAIELSYSEGSGLIASVARGTAFPLTDLFSGRRMSFRARYEDSLISIPSSYVPSKFGGHADLAEAWDEVVLTDGEKYALDALRLIEPETEGLAFVQVVRSRRAGSLPTRTRDERSAVLRVKSSQGPVPLQSMGDGMTRVLQLILAAFRAKGGFLLIDELENGLHFSVQVQVWRLLFSLAKANGTQVFATSHSLDCVRAFSHVAESNDLDGVLIRMERSSDQTMAAEVDETSLHELIESMIEVR